MSARKPIVIELPTALQHSSALTRRWAAICTGNHMLTTPGKPPAPPICDPDVSLSPPSAQQLWAAPHLALAPATQASADTRDHSLVLFLPATGSRPADYTRLLRAASDAGHHVLALSYASCPVAVARANAFCALQKDAAACVTRLHDTSVFPRRALPPWLARGADGLWHVPARFSVERLATDALRSVGWKQFLTAHGTVRWDRVVAAGHSQGGGHAAYLSRRKGTRAVLLSAPQDEPAGWVSGIGRADTRADVRRIALFHAREECGDRPCSKNAALRPGLLVRNLVALGLRGRCTTRGARVPEGCDVVAVAVRPVCRTGRTYHSSVAKDRCAPRVMDQLWKHLFQALR